jgi:hypothetical protein
MEEKEWLERHLAQARLISAILGPQEGASQEGGAGRTAVDLLNSSGEPVYRLVVAIVFIQGAGPETIERWLEVRPPSQQQPIPVTTASVLPPGTFRIWIRGMGWSAIMSGRSSVEVAFTDRAGSHWVRRATGQLEELNEEPLEYFGHLGFYAPHDLLTPERIP